MQQRLRGDCPAASAIPKAYRKNPERMIFEIKKITIIGGEYTDLKCVEDVFDIELGELVK